MNDMLNKQEFLSKVIKNASENPEFRQRLTQNAKEVIEEMVNFKFPEEYEIEVHEDTPSKLNIVLPSMSEELSEVDLSAISGGVCWNHSCQDYVGGHP